MRKVSIVGMALAVLVASLAVAATASAAKPTATLNLQFLPSSGVSATTPTAGGLYVETTSLDPADAGTPTNPGGPQPDPTTNVRLDFDKDFVFAPNSVTRCASNLANTTTQAAMLACGDSQVGGGVATLCSSNGVGGCIVGQAVVTAFNGPKVGNQSTILLHARSDAFNLTQILQGTLKNSNLGAEFGKALHAPVPLAAGGAASITDLAVNVNNGAFVKASCSDGTWGSQARFTFNTTGSRTKSVNQTCTN